MLLADIILSPMVEQLGKRLGSWLADFVWQHVVVSVFYPILTILFLVWTITWVPSLGVLAGLPLGYGVARIFNFDVKRGAKIGAVVGVGVSVILWSLA